MCIFNVARSFCFVGVVLLSGLPLAAQDRIAPTRPPLPSVACKPPVAADFASLRVFNGTAPVPLAMYCGEQDATACHIETLDLTKPDVYQGDLIAPAGPQGFWTCALVGGWAGWVPSARLSPVPSTPAITTQQWLGMWSDSRAGAAGDRLVITRSAKGHGIIHVEGHAQFTNAAHNTDTGQVSGDAIAMGPYLRIFDQGGMDGCVLDLTYNSSTDSFRAVDNQQCGGHNVSFNASYHRRISSKARP